MCNYPLRLYRSISANISFGNRITPLFTAAHNNIAEIGADFGIFAVLFEEIIILYPLIKDKNSNKNEKIFTGLFCAYIFLIQLFLVVFNSKVECILLPLVFILTNDKEAFYKYDVFKKFKPQRLESEQVSV